MKKMLRLLVGVLLFLSGNHLFAQCTTASLNWDALDFLQESAYVSNVIATNQKFAFGKNRLTITHNYVAANVLGDNTTHTGETGAYGTGSDIQFLNNGTITFTFQSAVQNVKFSLFDIDYNQKITITATHGTTAQNVGISKVSGTNLTIAGNNTTSASATAGATNAIDVTSSDGTVNVDVAGPVTSVSLVISQTATKTNGQPSSQEDGSFWISDIQACVTGSFPNAYHIVSRPFTGQPGYILVARDNYVNRVDPATGKATLLFSDPSGQNINSMAYDPYNHILYFANSLTLGGSANPNNKTLKKYDFNTETISTVISDITTLGIPVFGSGIESGGASFYDGALYIGIEGTAGGESIVWRIDFDASLNPVSAMQVFGTPTDAHDWGDFVIGNGIFYDFDGKASGGEDIYHLNLQTGAIQNFSVPLPFSPRQAAIDWNEQVYNIGGAAASIGEVAPYNYNGTIASAQQKTIILNGATPSGSWGDGAEAFRPKADFGDAPDSYDPDPLAPALHETDNNLKLGTTIDSEWSKTSSVLADADGSDEDGLAYVPIYSPNLGYYYAQVKVYNNTGANATVCAWLDYNNNGVFDSGEGISRTVASSATATMVDLYWTMTATLPANSYIYLRIRVTSAANGMTVNYATGYFANGEVEDYRVPVSNVVLPLHITGFTARKQSEEATLLNWSISDARGGALTELQRSDDGVTWRTISQKKITENKAIFSGNYTDSYPVKPLSYYRLKVTEVNGATHHSTIQKVAFSEKFNISLYPNPASNELHALVVSDQAGIALFRVFDGAGKVIYKQNFAVQQGNNVLHLPFVNTLTNGLYTVQVLHNNKTYQHQLIINKN
ncbi:MAG: T9SS type A sorting domain-containing protein [Bacteroidota bacterium]|nr:T9SS type A sorting domain-containing protein [Bacteroidota bacterium]